MKPKRFDKKYGHPNWDIATFIDAFNKHMKENFYFGMVVVPDEMILQSYTIVNPNRKIVGINTRRTGPELKDSSDAVTNIITEIELVKNKKFMDA